VVVEAVVAVAVTAAAVRLVTRRATIVVGRVTLLVNVPTHAWKGMTAKSSTRLVDNTDVASTAARLDTFPPTAPNQLVTKLVTTVAKRGTFRVIVRMRVPRYNKNHKTKPHTSPNKSRCPHILCGTWTVHSRYVNQPSTGPKVLRCMHSNDGIFKKTYVRTRFFS
jgi:hypothetical protein